MGLQFQEILRILPGIEYKIVFIKGTIRILNILKPYKNDAVQSMGLVRPSQL